jgi:protocatechuate 3,4-dioxygenase beta subunit
VRVIPAVILGLTTLSFQGPPPPPLPPPMVQSPRDPVRRPSPEPTGTAVIRGRVVAADTGNPIRRANVSLSMMPPPTVPSGTGTSAAPVVGTARSTQTAVINGVQTSVINGVQTSVNIAQMTSVRRTATTDAQGAFEFRDLPEGSYRLSANPGQYAAAYLPTVFGAKKLIGPGIFDPGQPIQLAAGQAFAKATIALPRGGVITGRVSDENGDPLARVQVYTLFYPAGSSRPMRTGMAGQTDDLGQYRLFGLTPGDYVVVAEVRSPTFVQPNAPPETEDEKIGLMTSYYPGTADEESAQRVQARSGAETTGIEFRMASGRLFHVSGMVVDSQGRPLSRSNGSMNRRSGAVGGTSFGFSVDEQGRFQMRSIPPGSYRLNVRQQQQGPRNADGSPADPGEFASMPLTISSDVENIMVTTSPGVTITGNVVFENGPPQLQPNQQSFQMRVTAQMPDPENFMGAPSPPPALVGPDLTFTMKGMAGEFLLRASAPGNSVKAIMLGAEDITDTPREFRATDRVTVVMTSRLSTLEGNVTDGKGEPVAGAGLIVFSEDKASWRWNSIRTRRSSVDQNGHYRISGLLPGRYFIIAMPRERANVPSFGSDPGFFETLSKDATSLVVGDDEQRQVDLKLIAAGG